MKEAQELHCHECNKYVRFVLDVEIDGNYTIICPNCGHEHLRIVEDGKVTDKRWGSRNIHYPTYLITNATTSTTAFTGSSLFLTSSWGTMTSNATGTW